MRRHLYLLKKQCPGFYNDIELTEDIKNKVLTNRVYEIKTTEKQKDGPTINLNNYVFEMDTKDKLESVLDYEQKRPVNLGDQIERANSQKIEKLEDRSYKYGFKLDRHNLFELVDQSIQLTCKNDIHKMNLHYIPELGKIAIYHDDEWTNYLYDSGINKVINIIRNYYLESYEKYMLYKIFIDKRASAFECNDYKNQLNDYFQFLIAFDLYPSSKDEGNTDFLPGFDHDNKFFISDFCMKRYNEQKDELKRCDINKIRKLIGDIIKTNSIANVKMLNKHVINLAVNDEKFREKLLAFSN